MTIGGPTVVVVGAGYEGKRRYYQRLAGLGARLVIVDSTGEWCRRHGLLRGRHARPGRLITSPGPPGWQGRPVVTSHGAAMPGPSRVLGTGAGADRHQCRDLYGSCRRSAGSPARPQTHRMLSADGRHQPDGHRAWRTGRRVSCAGWTAAA
jgi:hypothetical protein